MEWAFREEPAKKVGIFITNKRSVLALPNFKKNGATVNSEDNWRRSNKQQQALTDDFGNSTSQASDSAAGDAKSETSKDGLVYRDKASMLKDIPLTSDAIKK